MKMKIVYCIAGTYNSGGMERVLANKCNWLAKNGHEITIITTDQRGQKPFFHINETVSHYDLGINYEINNGKSFLNKLIHYPYKQFLHKKRLSKLLKKLKADIVISMFCNDVSLITSINDGSKKILEIHFSKFKRLQYDRKGIWRIADRWRSRKDERYVRKFDAFVVLTNEDKGYWGNLNHIKVIPNARTFTPTVTTSTKQKQIIAIGRYNYQKGFDMLIDIWAEVCSKTDDWTLEIIGDGVLKDYLQQKIDEYHISDRTFLVKATENIEAKYLSASILVMTSRYEGLPMILLEAQSFGLPIVAYACKCGPKDVITDGVDGFLIPPGDKKLFAVKLIELMKDELLRKEMGKKAKLASSRYAENKIMKQWVSLFYSLTK